MLKLWLGDNQFSFFYNEVNTGLFNNYVIIDAALNPFVNKLNQSIIIDRTKVYSLKDLKTGKLYFNEKFKQNKSCEWFIKIWSLLLVGNPCNKYFVNAATNFIIDGSNRFQNDLINIIGKWSEEIILCVYPLGLNNDFLNRLITAADEVRIYKIERNNNIIINHMLLNANKNQDEINSLGYGEFFILKS